MLAVCRAADSPTGRSEEPSLGISPKRLWAFTLAIVLLTGHLLFLPSTLEDIDSVNFALGIHDFDPVKHQPHPPGYPVFIALAKVARAVVSDDARALGVLGALFGALAVFPLMKVYECFGLLETQAHPIRTLTPSLATLLTVASPLYWFTAGRPMSDIPGLSVTVAAQALLVSAFVQRSLNSARTREGLVDSGKMIGLGAFLSALAIGMRSQAIWLTVPLLGLVLVQRARYEGARAVLGSAMTFALGVLIWAVPLLIASGGPMAYRAAVTAQGRHDFAGVDMLYRNPGVHKLAVALLETFIHPWGSWVLGWTILVLAAVGTLTLLRRVPRIALLLGVLVGPYLLVHLLFQETVTTRYALPLIPVMAFLAVSGVSAVVRSGAMISGAVAVLVVWSLSATLPSFRVYATQGSPAFVALSELRQRLSAEPGAVVAMHHGLLRSVQTQNFGTTRVLKAPPMREWLELAAYWREGHTAPVWFLADPARTDIELIDPLSRTTQGRYAWGFPRARVIGGMRPEVVDLVRIESPPGWFAEEGWHLTPETLNMSERLGTRKGIAHIKSRADAALLVIGAESKGGPAHVSLQLNNRPIGRWDIPAFGTVFERVVLQPGSLSGRAAYQRLVASYGSSDGAPVRVTHFAVASPCDVFYIQHAGWNEIEYSRDLQRRWRWAAGRAETFINSAGKDVTLTISGESPLRYFETAPTVIIRAGAWILATASPEDDFELNVPIPSAALAASDGLLTIETDKTFVPHERSGNSDRRTLGLRIFRFEIR